MNCAVITACMFETRRPIWRLDYSCEKFGIELRPYGLGLTYTDWPDIKITKMLEHFKKLHGSGYDHVLYTDGRDSFFVAPLQEALDKYEQLGSPGCLMAAEMACYPRAELWDKFPDPGTHYRWPGSGQFIGRLDYMIAAWEMLYRDYWNKEGEDQNEQGWMLDAYVQGKFAPEFKLDTGCQIFQSAGNGNHNINGIEVIVRSGRIYNKITDSWPVAIHFNGGYSDPETGKDPVMAPMFKALGWEV